MRRSHVDYPEPNTGVFIEGFRRLKEAGTVRAWGVSTSDIDHLRRFNAEGDCGVLQVDYSILNRIPERDVVAPGADRKIWPEIT